MNRNAARLQAREKYVMENIKMGEKGKQKILQKKI